MQSNIDKSFLITNWHQLPNLFIPVLKQLLIAGKLIEEIWDAKGYIPEGKKSRRNDDS